MLNAIVFDWHGVLDKRTFKGMMKKLVGGMPDEEERTHYFREFGEPYEAGNMDPGTFWDHISALFKEQTREARDFILNVERDEMLWGALPDINKRFDTYILSGCPYDKLERIRSGIDLDAYFKKSYFSCEYGMTKRNPEFFRLLLDENGLKAEECLMVDDSEKVLKRAELVGYNTHLYSNLDDLMKDIDKYSMT